MHRRFMNGPAEVEVDSGLKSTQETLKKMQLECFTMPETDIRLSWSQKDPFQFNPELTLPDFDFDKKKITLTKCDKSYETGTYR